MIQSAKGATAATLIFNLRFELSPPDFSLEHFPQFLPQSSRMIHVFYARRCACLYVEGGSLDFLDESSRNPSIRLLDALFVRPSFETRRQGSLARGWVWEEACNQRVWGRAAIKESVKFRELQRLRSSPKVSRRKKKRQKFGHRFRRDSKNRFVTCFAYI